MRLYNNMSDIIRLSITELSGCGNGARIYEPSGISHSVQKGCVARADGIGEP